MFVLPDGSDAAALKEAALGMLRAVAEGTLTTDEAAALMPIVDGARRTVETEDLEARIQALEASERR